MPDLGSDFILGDLDEEDEEEEEEADDFSALTGLEAGGLVMGFAAPGFEEEAADFAEDGLSWEEELEEEEEEEAVPEGLDFLVLAVLLEGSFFTCTFGLAEGAADDGLEDETEDDLEEDEEEAALAVPVFSFFTLAAEGAALSWSTFCFLFAGDGADDSFFLFLESPASSASLSLSLSDPLPEEEEPLLSSLSLSLLLPDSLELSSLPSALAFSYSSL